MQNLSPKRARDYYRRMLISDARELSDVYADCSDAKRKAYEYCLKLFEKYHGTNFRIVGHNCMTFTVAFEGVMPETGEVGIFVITRSYDYFYPYDENMR